MAGPHLESIKSVPDPLDPLNHEVDIAAITSQPVALSDVGNSFTEEQKIVILTRLQLGHLLDSHDLPLTATFMITKCEEITIPESIKVLEDTLADHADDINFPHNAYELIQKLVKMAPQHQDVIDFCGLPTFHHLSEKGSGEKNAFVVDEDSENLFSNPEDPLTLKQYFSKVFDWSLQTKLEASLIAYHSPYPEVRSITVPYDDPTIPCETLRVYIISYFWTLGCSVINTYFDSRYPAMGIPSQVAELFIYLCGITWAKYVPSYKLKVYRNLTIDTNPGKWSLKEQILCMIIKTTSDDTGYAGNIIMVQKVGRFFDDKWLDWGYMILLAWSTGLIGYGLAGLLRKFTVYPTKALWPSILPSIAMNKALVDKDSKSNINGWTISRFSFFFLVAGISFIYYWIPDVLFTALSTFNWLTWIAPNNFTLAAITGSSGGLGLNPFPSFDWNVLESVGPNYTPWVTNVTLYIGALIGFVIIVGIYWSNYYWTAYLPINSNGIFDNTGDYYNSSRVLNARGIMSKEKYEVYGPPFYAAANYVSWGANFALYPFLTIYEFAIRWKDMKVSFRNVYLSLKDFKRSNFEGYNDPHSRMMAAYKEVPDWWYISVLIFALVLGILCVELYPTNTPVWTLFFAVGINLVFMIPNNILHATANASFSIVLIVELILGYIFPGNPRALMIAKAFGYESGGEASSFVEALKMGHYIKIPPRAIFRSQIICTITSLTVSIAVLNWQLATFEGICTPHQKQKFICPGATSFFSNTVLWGVIGPKKIFNGLYPFLKWAFLIGFLLIFPCLFVRRYLPRDWKPYFQPSVVILGVLSYAPGNLSYMTGGMYLSWFFMVYLRKNCTAWWEKYNYVFASAMDCGVAISGLIIFFALQYHSNVVIDWWGNNVSYAGIDGGNGQQSLLDPLSAPDGYFGPRVGHFP